MSEQFLQRVFFILAIIGLTLFASHMIIISYRDLQEIGVFEVSSSPRAMPRLSPRRQRFTPTPSDVDLIQGWMTIAYINRMYGLPADYLKTQLNLTNPKYPNIVIEDIAKQKKMTTNALVEQLKQRVAQHLEARVKTPL